ncbi:MAG TPA: hypothetical protein VF179_27415 [Thermoanaerobaculia bacterium]|nr:hypothetical protein [Thermoanaerobaculia bacterium]
MKSFWKKLNNVTPGPNTFGDITLQGPKLQSQYDAILNPPGRIRIEATPFGGGMNGYQLRATEGGGPNVEEVYWLPWLDQQVTSAMRADFENSHCNFFLTTGLTGCRFTVSPDLVLHVAATAGGGTHASRSQVEEELTGPRNPLTRRLSSTHTGAANDFHYPGLHRTLVFGIKRHAGAWTYKIFRTHPPPGSWETLL